MNDLPVLFMTKETAGREGIAERTIEALNVNRDLFFYVALAGSFEYLQKIVSVLENCGYSGRYFFFQFEKTPAGYAWNRTIQQIFEDGHEMYLRMEDDFLLKKPLDISVYMEMLESNSNIGMVRLGLMPTDLNLHSVGWYDRQGGGHIFFDCLPTSPYAYSGNPGLVHKRLHDQVGYFHEAHNPGDIEIDFDSRVRDNMGKGGCRIWYPLNLGCYGTYGPWDHIGEVKSY